MVFAGVATQQQVTAALEQGVGGLFLGGSDVWLLQTDAFGAAVAGADPQPFVATDEEGGRVQRLADLIGALPSARAMHETMTPAAIETTMQRHGEQMANLGVTMDFAPVVDVSAQANDEVIGDRSFSDDPADVATDAVAYAKGLQAAGVTPVFKHFPGHGHGSGDSHHGLVTTPPLEQLRTNDLVPFADGLGAVPGAAVMVGHLIVPGLTDGKPASVSRAAITDLLRGQLGFDGLVVTDDLGAMRGVLDVYGTPSAAAVEAAAAGADLVLVPAASVDAVIDGIAAAVEDGTIDERQVTASAQRILQALPGNRCA